MVGCMIERQISAELKDAAREYPTVTVFGPRQSGKTTLVRMVFPDKVYRSLEDPDIRAAAQIDPRGFLADLRDGAILDEIQRAPDLLSYLQGVVDQSRKRGLFILTGSHQPRLHEAISQSLAGRTAVLTLLGFSLEELSHYRTWTDPYELIVQGAFPGLHEHGLKPRRFYASYIQTYLERDVRALINLKDLSRFQALLTLLAGRVGQVANYTALSNDVGVSSTTIKDWTSALTASFVLFELPSFFENIRKRVVKAPKFFFTDTGLVCHLLGIDTPGQAKRDPLRGHLYENWLIMEILKARLNRGLRPDLYFYRDSHGNEGDLIVREAGRLYPVEIKSAHTFTPEFLRGIESFTEAVGRRAGAGSVLYDGDSVLTVKGVRVLNYLRHGRYDQIVRSAD
jgi:predicted AAA+ superfamily ATPase